MSLSAVVISLPRAAGRRDQVQKIVDQCPVDCRIWDATDGAALTPDEISSVYAPRLHAPDYPFPLSRGEIGCYLSHRGVWEMMVREGIDRLLVLEDDIDYLPGFSEALQAACSSVPDDGYVQFQVRPLVLPARRTLGSGEYALIEPVVVPLRATAQLITLGAAQRLLAFSQQFDRPVDTAIQMTWLHGASVFMSRTRSVVEVSASLGGSTIGVGKRRAWLPTVTRQWQRLRYRQQIQARSSHGKAA